MVAPRLCLGALGLAVLQLGCGVDNVPLGAPSDWGSGGEGGADATSGGASSGGATSGGASSGGATSGGASSGGRTDISSGQSWLTDPTTFYACQTEADTIEVRGVRDEACWLVVLARDVWPKSRCHPGPQKSPDWCVIEVQYSDTRAECQRKVPAPSANYLSTGSVGVSQDGSLDIALDFSNPDLAWESDVPFAVTSCKANCSDQDCRR